MKLLAIDTSTKTGSIALLDETNVVSETALNVEVTHSEKLLPAIEKMFAEARFDFSELEGLAVAIGPGSFTGLRIGLATMKGFAQALDLPLVGVPSLILGDEEEGIPARRIGILGLEKLKRGEGKNWRLLTPNYLRKSYAEKI